MTDLEAADRAVICDFEQIKGRGAGEELGLLLKEHREQGSTELPSLNFEGAFVSVRLGSEIVWSSIPLPVRLYLEDGGLSGAGSKLAQEIMGAVSTILHEEAEHYDLRDVQGVVQMAITDVLLMYALQRRCQLGPCCSLPSDNSEKL